MPRACCLHELLVPKDSLCVEAAGCCSHKCNILLCDFPLGRLDLLRKLMMLSEMIHLSELGLIEILRLI